MLLGVTLVVVTVQLTVPDDLLFGPHWMFPVAELVLAFVILVAEYADDQRAANVRGFALGLGMVMAAANTITAGLLVESLVTNPADTATQLLVTGVKVLLTNMLAYAVLYWLIDGGGPVRRADGTGGERDFQFPQDETDYRPPRGQAESGPPRHQAESGPPQGQAPGRRPWLPHLGDYLYLAYTNAVAFSPTDAMPLSLRVKGLMAVQSVVALSTIGVTLARAINILPAT